LNDLFGFKPDQIEFQKLNQPPSPNPRLPGPSNPPQKNPPANDKDEEIRQLKAQIKALEEKLRQNPNSPTFQQDKITLQKLKKQLSEKEKSNSQPPNKDQFPYLPVIGVSLLAIFLIVIVYLVGRSRRHPKNS